MWVAVNDKQSILCCMFHACITTADLSVSPCLMASLRCWTLIDQHYHKPTHTDQLLNFNSHHPVSITLCLPLLIVAIPSHQPSWLRNRKVFTANSYSRQFVHQTLYCSLGARNTSRSGSPQAIVSIPYIKGTLEHIRNFRREFLLSVTLEHSSKPPIL